MTLQGTIVFFLFPFFLKKKKEEEERENLRYKFCTKKKTDNS
jgi:hypothetical protein